MNLSEATAAQHVVSVLLDALAEPVPLDPHLFDDASAHALVTLADRSYRALSAGTSGDAAAARLLAARAGRTPPAGGPTLGPEPGGPV